MGRTCQTAQMKTVSLGNQWLTTHNCMTTVISMVTEGWKYLGKLLWNNGKVSLVKQSKIQFENREFWWDHIYATLMQDYLNAFCSCQILPSTRRLTYFNKNALPLYILLHLFSSFPSFWHLLSVCCKSCKDLKVWNCS